MRTVIANRRPNLTTVVQWTGSAGPDHKLIVTFGIERKLVKEAFCAGFRSGTDVCALANDACIMMSLLLQHGVDISTIADACGQEREGQPSSLLGAIAREGVIIQKLIQEKK